MRRGGKKLEGSETLLQQVTVPPLGEKNLNYCPLPERRTNKTREAAEKLLTRRPRRAASTFDYRCDSGAISGAAVKAKV